MPEWKNLLDSFVAGTSPTPPHAAALRIPRIDGWVPGRVWCTTSVGSEFVQPQGAVFGGYVGVLADEMLGMATLSVLADDEVCVTSDLHLYFFRPMRAGELKMEGRVVHKGRSNVQVEVTFADGEDRLLAKANATQVIKRVPSE